MADPYLQTNGTLRNCLGIRDALRLSEAEKHLSGLRMAQLVKGDGAGFAARGLDDLKTLHKFLFQDVYPWAGTTRAEPFAQESQGKAQIVNTNVVIHKGPKTFARPELIAIRFLDVEASLRSGTIRPGMKLRDFVISLADLLAEINDIHPFREGNGRAQRAFVKVAASRVGRKLDFDVISAERMVAASVATDKGDRSAMRRLVRDASSVQRVSELKKAQAALERMGFDWMDRYLGFVEPGEKHRARLVGTSKRQFMCLNGNKILVGWLKDLPAGSLKNGQTIEFTGRGAPTEAVANTRKESDLGR